MPGSYLVGILYFEDMTALQAAFASPEGAACTADRKILASDENIQTFIFEAQDI